MIHVSYRITCSVCGRREFNEGHDEQTDMLADAKAAGWDRRTVQNGSEWDYCPRCLGVDEVERMRAAEAGLDHVRPV